MGAPRRPSRARASGYAVRPARAGDADALGRVSVQVWRETYRDLMPADYLAALDPAQRARLWRLRIELDEPSSVLVVAVDPGEEVVGFACAGAAADADGPAPWQLYAINVLAGHRGTGLADDLVRVAVGDRAAYLWVLRDNPRAHAFYRRHGFAPDGATQADEDTGAPEVRLVRGEQAAPGR